MEVSLLPYCTGSWSHPYGAARIPAVSHESSSRPVPAIPDCILSPSSPCCFWRVPVPAGTSLFPVWPAAFPLQTSDTLKGKLAKSGTMTIEATDTESQKATKTIIVKERGKR